MTTTSDQYLTADRVRQLYARCARPEGSTKLSRLNVEVEAWMLRHTFSIRWIQKNREEIIRALLSLPDGFRADVGEGGSVLAMRERGDGSAWTDDKNDVERLIALGMAAGLVTFCAPRDKWAKLPGGLPYVRVEITRFGVSVN